MKKNLKKVVLVLALLLPGVIKAQEFNVTAKADFVSDYIWRGAYQNSGFSVQPTLGLSYGNLSLSAWGSQSLTKTDGAQEFDINLKLYHWRFRYYSDRLLVEWHHHALRGL